MLLLLALESSADQCGSLRPAGAVRARSQPSADLTARDTWQYGATDDLQTRRKQGFGGLVDSQGAILCIVIVV